MKRKYKPVDAVLGIDVATARADGRVRASGSSSANWCIFSAAVECAVAAFFIREGQLEDNHLKAAKEATPV